METANLDPAVHVIALSGNGKGFCGGYDLVISAEGNARADGSDVAVETEHPEGSPLDPLRQVRSTRAGAGALAAPCFALTSASPRAGRVQGRQAQNHVPGSLWDPVVDYQMMSRNVRGTTSRTRGGCSVRRRGRTDAP